MSVINLLPLSSKSTLSVCPAIMEVDTINISPCHLVLSEALSAEGAGGIRRRSGLLLVPWLISRGSCCGWGSRQQFWWPAVLVASTKWPQQRPPAPHPEVASPWPGHGWASIMVFPLPTLLQGSHREGRQLGELALDSLSESKIQQCPEISVLLSSTPAGGFLETQPPWHLGGCACHPVSHTHSFQPTLDLRSGQRRALVWCSVSVLEVMAVLYIICYFCTFKALFLSYEASPMTPIPC